MSENARGVRNLNPDSLAAIPRPIIFSLSESKLSSQPLFHTGFLAFGYFGLE